MQAHFLGAGEYPLGEGKLHHGFAARDGQTAAKRADRGGEALETLEHLLCRHVSAILEVPRVRVVAIRATQKATRHEQHDTQAGSIVTGRRLIGVAVAEDALSVVLKPIFIRRVGRDSSAQVISAARLQ